MKTNEFTLNQLYVLDEELDMVLMEQRRGSQSYEEILRKSLKKIDALVKAIEETSNAFSNICISKRCIVVSNQVFAIQSGKKYNFFQQKERKDDE